MPLVLFLLFVFLGGCAGEEVRKEDRDRTVSRLRREISIEREKNRELETRIRGLETQRDRLSQDSGDLRRRLRELKRTTESVRRERDAARRQVAELQEKLKASWEKQDIAQLKEKQAELEKRIETLTAEREELQARIRDLKGEGIVARIDGEPVTVANYREALYQRYKRSFLDAYLNEVIVERAAKDAGIELESEEIEAWIDNRIAMIEKQVGGPEKLAERLRDSGKPRSALRDDLRLLAKSALYARKLLARERTSEEYIQRLYAEKYGPRVRLRHILISPDVDPDASKAEREKAEAEALEKARQIRKRLQEGADFATLARSESADRETAKKGGAFGRSFHRYELIPAFSDVAFGLEPGVVSEPVESEFGYHIIRVDDIEPAEKSLDEVRDELEQSREEPIRDDEVEKLLNRLRHEVTIEKVLR